MKDLFEKLEALKPVRMVEELTPAAQDVLKNACVETLKRKRNYDAFDVDTYLTPEYLNAKAPKDVKKAQFDAMHFLVCLERVLLECANSVYYKRDSRGWWDRYEFSDLADAAGFNDWRADATYSAIFGEHEPGDSIGTAVYKEVARVLDDYDRAGVFVTDEKPADWEA